MSALQWVLLIVSVVIVLALVAHSRRDRGAALRRGQSAARSNGDGYGVAPVQQQMDIFARGSGAGADSGEQFDEFGVGRPRVKRAPSLFANEGAPVEPAPPAVDAEAEDHAASSADEATFDRPAPAFLRVAPPADAPLPGPTQATPPPRAERIVTLLIAERSGLPILGPKIHTALRAQGLSFGGKQIYHRMVNGKTVFSVASLIKPGVLVPEEAPGFSTPGLSLFMVLPGPLMPVSALQDMLGVAQNLARALNAEVYDSRRQPLTAESIRELQDDVERWWRGG